MACPKFYKRWRNRPSERQASSTASHRDCGESKDGAVISNSDQYKVCDNFYAFFLWMDLSLWHDHWGKAFCFYSLPFISATADGPKHIDTTLTRVKFEELCSDLLDRYVSWKLLLCGCPPCMFQNGIIFIWNIIMCLISITGVCYLLI